MHSQKQLKPLERASRIYCGKVGLQADTEVPMPHPDGLAVMVPVPVWCCVAEELLDLVAKFDSLQQAAAEEKAIEGKKILVLS